MLVEARTDVRDVRGTAVGFAVEPKLGRLGESGQLLEFDSRCNVNVVDCKRSIEQLNLQNCW